MKIIYAFILLVLVISCEESNENASPTAFEVNLDEVYEGFVKLIWTESIDQEGGEVTYEVYLNDVSVADNVTDLFFTFNGLDEDTTHVVKIIASDPEGNQTSAQLSFNLSENQPPSEFTISVISNNPFNTKIEWTESIDPEGTNVSYSIFVNDEEIASDLSQLHFNIGVLRGLEEYDLKVIAKDEDGRITPIEIQFTTAIKIHEGTIDLNDQSTVEFFGEQGYNQINGNLIIGSTNLNTTDVDDISSLSSLINLNGNLWIMNTICQELTGLNNMQLTADYPQLTIEKNTNLLNLEGLNSIQYGHRISIALNDNLQTLEGLDALQVVTNEISVVSNASLYTLIHLNVLNSVASSINILNNDSLSNLEGLENLTSLSAVTVCCNENLTSLKGLENLSQCEGVRILDNSNLLNLSDLFNLNQVSFLTVSDNPLLTSLSGLESVTQVNHTLEITNNDGLTSLDGIQNIAFVSDQNYHELIIRQNDNLTNLDVLTGYSYDRGKVFITENINLTDLCGISNLVLGMTEFLNYFNFAIGNGYNPGIVQFQNGDCAL